MRAMRYALLAFSLALAGCGTPFLPDKEICCEPQIDPELHIYPDVYAPGYCRPGMPILIRDRFGRHRVLRTRPIRGFPWPC